MKLLKIYDKDFNQLTTLTQSDFLKLSYKKTLLDVGECQFLVRLDQPKISNENLEMYNRVEIVEDDVVVFIGVIVRRIITLDTAEIRCRELTYVLKKRLLAESYVVSGDIKDKVPDVLDAVNGVDDTGITAGDVADAIGNVNTTFNRGNALDILKSITNATGNQFKLLGDRSISVKPSVGTDKSSTVVLRYDINLISAANLLGFEIEDDGNDIATRVYGKSNSYTTTQDDAGMIAKYGILEKYTDFRVVNSLAVLDDFAATDLQDRLYSPDIDLNPSVEDNFDIGDTIRIVLKNSLITIDDSFQVLEKRVQYSGDQKRITIKINDLPNYLTDKLNDRERRLELLEKQL